jgi:ParB family chromosome partitioning protein
MNETQNKNSEDGGKTIASVKIDEVIPNPNHVRKCIDCESLEALAETIKMVGILQPILVQKDEDEKIHLVAGERRILAAKIAGKTEIPALFVNLNSAAGPIIISLIENLNKAKLTPLDEAEAIQRLKSEFLISDRLLKPITGKTKKDLKDIWKINSLSKRVKECVHDIESTYGKVVAKSALIRLSAMEDDDEKIYELNTSILHEIDLAK